MVTVVILLVFVLNLCKSMVYVGINILVGAGYYSISHVLDYKSVLRLWNGGNMK